jgi:hypothetical protein
LRVGQFLAWSSGIVPSMAIPPSRIVPFMEWLYWTTTGTETVLVLPLESAAERRMLVE